MSDLLGISDALVISDQEDVHIKSGIKSPLLVQAPLQVPMRLHLAPGMSHSTQRGRPNVCRKIDEP
jgi:hypothetical protein